MGIKKTVLGAALAAGMTFAGAANADVIAGWNFETNTPGDLSNSTGGPAVTAETGTGSLAGSHANAASDWSTPSGPASTNSYSVNTWGIGDYFQFSTSSTGYEDLVVSFDATGSNTGPKDFKIAYSTDGTNFTDFDTYSLINASWSSSESFVNPAEAHFSFDFSGITVLDDLATVYFRLIATSTTPIGSTSTFGSSGTSRIDNVTVEATLVPEPATLTLLGLGGLTMMGSRRRRSA